MPSKNFFKYALHASQKILKIVFKDKSNHYSKTVSKRKESIGLAQVFVCLQDGSKNNYEFLIKVEAEITCSTIPSRIVFYVSKRMLMKPKHKLVIAYYLELCRHKLNKIKVNEIVLCLISTKVDENFLQY